MSKFGSGARLLHHIAIMQHGAALRPKSTEDAMEFGAFLLMQSPEGQAHEAVFARGIEIAQAAERLGFDSVWCAEHHFSTYGYLSRPLMVAQHIAAKTERIRVGSAVVVLPLHHPLIVAEEIATADVLSGGRL